MPYYSIEHETRFEYNSGVRESVMEVRARPRDEAGQDVVEFSLSISPRCHVWDYRDFMGNHVHSFDIPQTHRTQTITARSLVRVEPPAPLPWEFDPDTWDRLGKNPEAYRTDAFEMTQPSTFAHDSALFRSFIQETGIERGSDPLSTVRDVCQTIFDRFEYQPNRTEVDSPIDVPLGLRAGVCQDFAHIMIAVLRSLDIPARYVSGYLFHRGGDLPAPERSSEDATHAWVETLLPDVGWVGFDPTHNIVTDDHYIRTAIGRDYADVPPTRGVFRGRAESKMAVTVTVEKLDRLPTHADRPFQTSGWTPPEPAQAFASSPDEDIAPFTYHAQQMQQQQGTPSQ